MKKINYFNNYQIDKSKWDICINKSINRKVYACSWYLDVVSNNWGALIYGDYELVFPIIFKKIFIFKKIYHPFFCQQLGPFSSDRHLLSNVDLLLSILDYLDRNYKKFHFSINNHCALSVKDVIKNTSSIIGLDRVNLELDLKLDYETIYSKYKQNTKRNLKKNTNYRFIIKEMNDVSSFISLYKKHIGPKSSLKSKHYKTIRALITMCLMRKAGHLIGLYDPSGNILACAFFVRYFNRDILLFNFSNKMMKVNVMTILIDKYIFLNSSKNKFLDFEGSSIPNIQRFYKGFGALEKNYIHIIK
tara:strand:+ start:1610 stop:2518 length:909 start_codon:yes stop_codon:yes gene_type:complete